jgi:hypothetical protein
MLVMVLLVGVAILGGLYYVLGRGSKEQSRR